MLELKYTKTASGWPVKAVCAGMELVFSGLFDEGRVRTENFHRNLELIEKIVLWLLSIWGLAALLFSGWAGWQTKNAFFFLTPTVYNLIFWTACFLPAFFGPRPGKAASKSKP
jgi:hypothetical protein